MIDQRTEERVAAALPVILNNAIGTTCDVSASGLFFETNSSFAVGSPIEFSVEFDAPGGKRMLKCHGQIIRTEQRSEDRIGVAIKVVESVMALAMNLSPEQSTFHRTVTGP